MTVGIFDPAIFDPKIFDTPVVAPPVAAVVTYAGFTGQSDMMAQHAQHRRDMQR